MSTQQNNDYQSYVFHAPWLDIEHDQHARHPVVSVEQYLSCRRIKGDILDEVKEKRHISDVETLSILQSLLFFGLLESAFGEESTTSTYIIEKNKRRVVNTSPLRDFLLDRQKHLRDHYGDEEYLRPYLERLVHSVEIATEWNTILIDINISPSIPQQDLI
jgi:hypothetical protein